MSLYSIKLAIRELLKSRFINLLNILGFSVSLAVVFLLFSFITVELNKGKHIQNSDEVFQLSRNGGGTLSYPMIKTFRENIPEITAITGIREFWVDKNKLIVGETELLDANLLLVDSSFFNVFSYNPVFGDPHQMINPSEIVLSATFSKSLFGEVNPVGSMITYKSTGQDDFQFKVISVIEDNHKDALLKFDALVSLNSLSRNKYYKQNISHWGNCSYTCYSRLLKETNPTIVWEKIDAVFDTYSPDWMNGDDDSFLLTKFSDIYLSASTEASNGNRKLVSMLAAIAIIILLVSWVNFVNIQLVQAQKGIQSITVKKYLGATRITLIKQAVINILPAMCMALVAAYFLLILLLPWFNRITDAGFSLSVILDHWGLVVIPPVFLTILICGLFTGLILSRSLKPNHSTVVSGNSLNFRSGLLVFQFLVSIILMISSSVFIKQFRYMQNASMGFNAEHIVHIDMLGELEGKTASFKEELLRIPGVLDITFASANLGNVYQGWGMTLLNKGESKRIGYTAMKVDENFFDFYGISLIQGENFGAESEKEKQHIFNKTAIKNFGIEKLADARISSYDNANGDIIGVVEDFNFNTLHQSIQNLGFLYEHPDYLKYIYLKTAPMPALEFEKVISSVEMVWQGFVPDWPMDWGFHNESLKALYNSEIKLSKLFIAATILSFVLTCIGLLGVSMFMVEYRIKEIGIRKVNGAKLSEILAIVNMQFIKWVVVAFMLACPLAWLGIQKWLQNFAYKTPIPWWFFTMAGLITFLIALLTISIHSFKAAKKNPVEALRYE